MSGTKITVLPKNHPILNVGLVFNKYFRGRHMDTCVGSDLAIVVCA